MLNNVYQYFRSADDINLLAPSVGALTNFKTLWQFGHIMYYALWMEKILYAYRGFKILGSGNCAPATNLVVSSIFYHDVGEIIDFRQAGHWSWSHDEAELCNRWFRLFEIRSWLTNYESIIIWGKLPAWNIIWKYSAARDQKKKCCLHFTTADL